MRKLLLAVTLLSTVAASAAPALQIGTEFTQFDAGYSSFVYLTNVSEETAKDVVVRFEHGPDLTIPVDVTPVTQNWQCTRDANGVTCRLAEFAAVSTALFPFRFDATDLAGGHRSASVSVTARDLPTPQTITFDVIAPREIHVMTDADFGAGSLRAAIEEVNEHQLCGTDVPCVVSFPTATTDGDAPPLTIKPATPLPAIRKCNVRILGPGDFQTSFADKGVVISGEHATHGNGLEVRTSCVHLPGVTLANLAVNSWPWNGVYFEAPKAHFGGLSGLHSVERLYVGTDATGRIARPNGSRGIVTDSPHELISIFYTIASGNARSGIALFRGRNAIIGGALLGVDVDGHPMGNGGAGLFSIDVPVVASRSTIAYNGMGVAVAKGTREMVLIRNLIHSNQGLAVDWGLDGRTPRDGETIQAPRILSAFYNASADTTYVGGVVYVQPGEFGNRFLIDPYISNERGDAVSYVPQFPDLVLAPPEGGEVAFEVGIPGDRRGKFIVLQTQAADDRDQRRLSSELSESIKVP
jgi:hypothetical protein